MNKIADKPKQHIDFIKVNSDAVLKLESDVDIQLLMDIAKRSEEELNKLR